jgi:hypothetical protein
MLTRITFRGAVLDRNEHGDTVAVDRIGHDRLQRRGLRDRLSPLGHAFEMERQGLGAHPARRVQRLAGGDDAH